MHSIFLGFLLIFLDFRLTFNDIVINCIPDFLGYIYIVKGLQELEQGSSFYSKAIPVAKLLIAWEIISFALDLFGISTAFTRVHPAVFFCIGAFVTAISLYCSYLIVKGVMENYPVYEADILFTCWKLSAAFTVITYVFAYVNIAVSFICLIILLIVNIRFLYALYKLSKSYQ